MCVCVIVEFINGPTPKYYASEYYIGTTLWSERLIFVYPQK